jgi:hypothetical protein
MMYRIYIETDDAGFVNTVLTNETIETKRGNMKLVYETYGIVDEFSKYMELEEKTLNSKKHVQNNGEEGE